MRTCTKCGVEKPYSEFYKRSNGYYQYGCKTCRKKLGAKRYSEHKEDFLCRAKEWHKKNPEARRKHKQKFMEKNPEYAKEYARDYFKRDYVKKRQNEHRRKDRRLNPEKHREKYRLEEARRRGISKSATPSWLTQDQLDTINAYYEFRKNVSGVVTKEYHVDHIVPLRGENVCGLHVPWNLQVIPAKKNLAKNNTWEWGPQD